MNPVSDHTHLDNQKSILDFPLKDSRFSAGDRVMMLCRKHGISLHQLARDIGLHVQTINKRLSGIRKSRDTAEAIATYFHLPPEDIFDDLVEETGAAEAPPNEAA